MSRRILRIDHGTASVAQEALFASEAQLHKAVADHPEVLPSEDFGMGPLVALASELNLGHGPIDLLAADPDGQLVIVEFKRGSQNPDVRKVVAQVLDYGSSLWRTPYEDLEAKCRRCPPGFANDLSRHARDRFDAIAVTGFSEERFSEGVRNILLSGDFVYLYVGRDLDERTRRIMTYLAEGPRMKFFAVEMDYFHAGDASAFVLVPRTAFVPTWVTNPPSPASASTFEQRAERAAGFVELIGLMNRLAAEIDLEVVRADTGWSYRAPGCRSGVGVYFTDRGIEFEMGTLRQNGRAALADQLTDVLSDISGKKITAPQWPWVSRPVLVEHWDRARRDLLIPYFQARGAQTESA